MPEALLARILEQVPKPVWVCRSTGLHCVRHPARATDLGLQRSRGSCRESPSPETVHYKRQDGPTNRWRNGEWPDVAGPADRCETVHSDDEWSSAAHGSMFPIA